MRLSVTALTFSRMVPELRPRKVYRLECGRLLTLVEPVQ